MSKHAVKQVDRLMSNASIDVWDSFCRRVLQQLGERHKILVAMTGPTSTMIASRRWC